MPELTKRDLIESLRSTCCPICGANKGQGKSTCYACWKPLPADLKKRSYCRIGQGYEEAMADVMKFHKVTEFRRGI